MTDFAPDTSPTGGAPGSERVPRGWMHLAALAGLTLVGLAVCVRLALPILPALAWAVALAVIADPLDRWVRRRVPNRTWSAAVSTALVALVVVVPVALVGARLADEAAQAAQDLREEGGWRAAVAKLPGLDHLKARLEHLDPVRAARRLVAALSDDVTLVLSGSLWGLMQAVVLLFALYYAFRDRDHLLDAVRRLLPVTRSEADHLFARTSDAIHATVYATLLTAVLQGVTGGLLFWAVGVPAPLLWGVVMFVFSVLPVVGAFVVWVPTAVALMLGDQWGAAAAVVAWGVVMAPVSNWVYARAAGGRLRLHPAPVLLAFVGGLAVFGLTGMVLGPVALAVTAALLEMWRHRAAPAPDPTR